MYRNALLLKMVSYVLSTIVGYVAQFSTELTLLDHMHNEIWEAVVRKMLVCERELINSVDRYIEAAKIYELLRMVLHACLLF